MWLQYKSIRLTFLTALPTPMNLATRYITMQISPKPTCCSSLSHSFPHWHPYLDNIKMQLLIALPYTCKIIFPITYTLPDPLAILSHCTPNNFISCFIWYCPHFHIFKNTSIRYSQKRWVWIYYHNCIMINSERGSKTFYSISYICS